MFALKPSNIYFLDEPSNHLDIECVEALSDAISGWSGDKVGALVVVSHDRNFCEKINFTHVATVRDGKFTIEERPARDSDWIIQSLSEATIATSNDDSGATGNGSTTAAVTKKKEITDPKIRKQLFNAPKRIEKIEKQIEDLGQQIAKLDTEMLSNGNDVGKLVDLNKNKEKLQSKIDALEAEWVGLEELIAEYGDSQ